MELNQNTLVLVTGATGLVGSHVAERLRQMEVPTRALVRSSADVTQLRGWGVDIAQGDLSDGATLESAVQDVNVIVHCAAKVGDWGPIDDYRRVNVEGLKSLIDATQSPRFEPHDRPLKRFVHISSLGVYEARDHYGTDERTPLSLSGIDGYTRTKAEAEALVVERIRQERFPAVVLRPGFVYGPRDRTVLPRLLSKLKDGSFRYLGSGQQLLNNTYVGNLVDAVLLAIGRDDVIGEVFNITDGRLVTKREFVGGIAQRAGIAEPRRKVPLPVARALAKVLEGSYRLLNKQQAPLVNNARVKFLGLNLDFSIDKARNALGYQPRVTFDEGMDRTFDWLRSQELA